MNSSSFQHRTKVHTPFCPTDSNQFPGNRFFVSSKFWPLAIFPLSSSVWPLSKKHFVSFIKFLQPYLNPPIPSRHSKSSPLWIHSWNLDKGLSHPTSSNVFVQWTLNCGGPRHPQRPEKACGLDVNLQPLKNTPPPSCPSSDSLHSNTHHTYWSHQQGLKPRASQITIKRSSCVEKR